MKLFKNLSILAVAYAVLLGCTEDRQQQSVLKPADQVMAKSKIDEKAHYLYVPLGQESSRTALYGRAFSVGDSQVVKIEINEFSMDIVAIERDKRFEGNPNNRKLLVSVPIEHVDYRCDDDAYGECVGNEVENERIDWKQRKFIKPDFTEADITDNNFGASFLAEYNDCYDLKRTEVLNRSIDDDAIHFSLKRDYSDKLDFFCTRSHDDLSNFANLNWTETTSYSLVKLDSIKSKGYKKALYHPDWINTFGFFETNNYELDVDGNATQVGEVKYIQRWNPERTEITYHLSESFNKPTNQVLKAATYESFRRLNDGLKAAGTKFRLNLKEPSPDVDPGDLRNSMVILVDDPAASSVIGYGPSITNPLTGEVISARTMMYSGSIRKFVRYAYEDIVKEHEKSLAVAAAEAAAEEAGEEPQVNNQLTTQEGMQESLKTLQMVSHQEAMEMIDIKNIQEVEILNQVDRTPELRDEEIESFLANESRRDLIALMAKENMYPAEALEFGDINQELVQEMIVSLGDLKPWETLNDIKKQKVLDILTPYVWVPTLIHEIGHNLGLRHNFSGSEDGDNFYSNEELKKMNVPVSSANVPYSSIMDYPKTEVNALRALGKYDIAALRFGYTEKAQLEDGSMAKVKTSEANALALKNYSYCSDEGAAPNPTCNPFDEGTDIQEIAASLIDSYKDRFERSNFRRGRASFSSLSDDTYLRRVARTFDLLRLVYERYESLVAEFQLDQETIDSVPFLKEIDDTVVDVADFLMEVVTTPDTTCIIANKQTGALQLAAIGIFSTLAHERTRECSKLQLNDSFSVIGQAGKPINSAKAPTNPNRFADQIDVRGTWMDKAYAMRTLFRRTMNSSIHDDTNGNFMDHPKVAPKLGAFVQNLLNNNLVGPVDVQFFNGQQQRVNLGTSLDEDFYEIPRSDLSLPSRMLGIPYSNMHLPQILVSVLDNGIYSGSNSAGNNQLKMDLKVYDAHPDPASPEYIRVEIGGRRLFIHQDSALSGPIAVASLRAEFYEDSGLDNAGLQKILALLEAKGQPAGSVALPAEGDVAPETPIGEVPAEKDPVAELTPQEKAVFDAGLNNLQAYLVNPTSSDYYKRILLSLL